VKQAHFYYIKLKASSG